MEFYKEKMERIKPIKKVLFIGDPHFKANNCEFTDIFIEECIKIMTNLSITNSSQTICVLAGDILDTHERLHQTPYNKAIKFIEALSQLAPVFILIGNHDYENNNQFLTDKHWMNPLKKWHNVFIAEKVLNFQNMTFVPFVPPGRFLEALDTCDETDWRNSKCIFAHQEMHGCNYNNIVNSETGDKWPLHYPLIISGHIHKSHRLQKNVIYPGSVIQHNFGEEDNDTGLFLIDLSESDEDKKFINIPLNIPKMITIQIVPDDFENTIKNLTLKPLQRIRIICVGTDENFKRIKKTVTYNNLPIGVTVSFKNNNIYKDDADQEILFESFDKILKNLISENHTVQKIFNDIFSSKSFEEML